MHISSDVTLPDVMTVALEEFASTKLIDGNPLPIRVLYGRFSVTMPEPWSAEQAEACGVSLDTAQAHGLTIVNWGAASAQYGREWTTLPGTFYTDNQERELEVRDIIVPQEDLPRQAIPYTFGSIEAGNFFDVGEIGDRCVWLYVNLTYLPAPEMLDLDSLLIEPCRRALDPGIIDEFRRHQEEASANAFAAAMAQNPERRVREQRDRISAQENDLRTYEDRAMNLRGQLDLMRRELDTILGGISQDPAHWKREWEHLAQHPMIQPGTLQMANQSIQYDTVLLNITDQDNGSEIPLGNFRIVISLENLGVTLHNLNNRRRNRDHPHVEDGRPCWGGYQAEVTDYVQNRRISALVEFIFGYLQSYNPEDDWGRYFAWWREHPELVGATS